MTSPIDTITTESPDAPSAAAGEPPLRGLGGWSIRHRWPTLIGAVLVLVGAVLLLAGGMTTTEPGAQLIGDSARAEKVRSTADFGTGPIENVVIGSRPVAPGVPTGRLDPQAASAVVRDLRAAYRGLPGIAAVGDPVPSADGTTMLLPVTLDAVEASGPQPAGTTSPQDAVAPMLDATRRIAAAHPGLAVGQVGPGSIEAEVGTQLEADFRRAELISLPVTVAILLLAFGTVVAAGVPMVLGIGAVAIALGLTAFASRHVVPVDPNAQPMVLLIGLAVGVDYALFVLRRSREERAAGASPRAAVQLAARHAGRAVLISGTTVVVAMAGMLVAGGLFTSIAIGTILVVAVAVVASATVLPALLALLGDRVEALRIPLLHRRSSHSTEPTGFWASLAGRVTRRPALWGTGAAVLLVAVALPALGMRTALPGAESLPRSFATVDAYTRLAAAFPQDGTTVDVVVQAPAAAADRVQAALGQGFRAALGSGEVVGDRPAVTASTDGRVHVLALAVPRELSDPRLDDVVAQVRSDVVPVITSALRGTQAQVHVGGAAADSDLAGWMTGRLPWVVAFVLGLTLVVMLLSFGSPWLAGATVALNLLSVGAAYGVMTLVFQHGWGSSLLGFTSIGSVASWIPLLLFVILFGLSMDYHVFVVSRVREAFTAGATPREAVRRGVARSAGVVTSAAVVMVAVFSIFATLSTLEMKELGIGLATAVLIDATIVRGVLLPAVLALLGRRAHHGPRWIPVLHH